MTTKQTMAENNKEIITLVNSQNKNALKTNWRDHNCLLHACECMKEVNINALRQLRLNPTIKEHTKA